MKIAVVGTGYVGLVVGPAWPRRATTSSASTSSTRSADAPARAHADLRAGPGRAGAPQRQEEAADVHDRPGQGGQGAEIVFIAVGTPQGEDGSADLRHVLDVARDIGARMNGYKVVVDKSTVPVGTAAKVREVIRRETTHPFSVVSNPEFLKEGAAIDDFLKPDRVVVGAADDKARRIMQELYAPFPRTGAPFMVMDCASAELTKYAANALLATKITFINEIANLCELLGADVDDVRRGIGSDRRIGSSFLFPGVGYGGSCFPKDVQAIVHFSGKEGLRVQDPRCRRGREQAAEARLVDKMVKHFGR